MRYFKYLPILFLCGLFSCDLGSEPEVTGTKLQAMAGEWWISIYVGGADIGAGYHIITTSNTAANNATDLLVDDGELWPAKVISKVDIDALTFVPATDLNNYYSPSIKVSIIEGKILKGGAITPGKNKTDSIYLKFEFSDDPGTQYEFAGYRRTGFQEDEH